MSFKLAIASGKGGTGKTTLSLGLFHFLSEAGFKSIQLVDCDVEEPNDALFFQNAREQSSQVVNQLIPEIDTNSCTFCRACANYCEFNAIVVIPPAGFAEVNPNLCHSCGACSIACKFNAITEKPLSIGSIQSYDVGIGKGLLEGRLKIGSAMQTMLIKEVKKQADEEAELLLFDAPPGTSCPVVETVADADYVLLVTEPTPFGLNDLKLTVELLRDIQKPFGIIVNKAGLGDNKLYEYMEAQKLELLGELPFHEDFARQYAAGNLLENAPDEILYAFKSISEAIAKKIVL